MDDNCHAGTAGDDTIIMYRLDFNYTGRVLNPPLIFSYLSGQKNIYILFGLKYTIEAVWETCL